MRIIMCDDNKYFLLMITDMIRKYAELYHAEVVTFLNANELLEYCRHHTFDIVYLDIEVGKNNGIDMAKILKVINPRALIIYMSAYDQYYVQLANAEPFRFIYKDGIPNEELEKKLADTLNEAVKRIEGKDSWNYTYNRKNYRVLLSKIECFCSSGRKVYIITECEIEQNYYYEKLDNIQEELEKLDNGFIRINNRVIVNMVHTFFKSWKKVEVNNKIYAISAKYREAFHEKYRPFGKIKI